MVVHDLTSRLIATALDRCASLSIVTHGSVTVNGGPVRVTMRQYACVNIIIAFMEMASSRLPEIVCTGKRKKKRKTSSVHCQCLDR